jgi:hypothetical protein
MTFGRFMVALPVAGALLVGCGGSGGAGGNPPVQAGQSGQVGNGIDTGPFIRMARGASCATATNRLFVIDGQFVLWDRAGACADASYEQVLYGATPQTLKCSHADSIAGPRTTCPDAAAKGLFDTLIANLGKPDLGVGGGHKVEPVAFLPADGTPVAFSSVAASTTSGVTTRKSVVIRDAAAWSALWAQHATLQLPAPPLPPVDFTRKMLVGVFAGAYHDACYGLGIAAVHAGAASLVVEVNERGPRMGVMCAQLATNPMQVAAVDRIDADVDFIVTPTVDVAFQPLATTAASDVTDERNVVARDADAFARLWAQFSPGTKPPQVDFGTNMVIGVFMGARSNGCYATGVGGIARSAAGLRVLRVDREPATGAICTQAIVTPAQLVVLEQSSLPVGFATTVAVQPSSP